MHGGDATKDNTKVSVYNNLQKVLTNRHHQVANCHISFEPYIEQDNVQNFNLELFTK